MNDISVVVPTYRRPGTLARTLDAMTRLEYPAERWELIVVDDAGDADTAAVVEQVAATPGLSVRLVRDHRHGAAAARNAGARAAGGKLLLFCDDDMLVARDHLGRHLATHEAYAGALVGSERWYSPAALAAFEATPFGRYRIDLERAFKAGLREEPGSTGCTEAPTLASCDLSVSRDAFWQLGGFDESFPYAGAEDQDLSTRALRAGLRLIRNRDIRPLHDDPTVTFRQFCQREERGAHTVLALGRKWPEMIGEFANNAPLTRSDPPALAAKKLAKSALSHPLALRVLHQVVDNLERAGASEAILRRAYRAVIGLHIFRGYREALKHA